MVILSNIKKKLLGVLQYYRILPILHEHANPACPLLVSMAIHGFDVAAGMSPEACSKCAHIFNPKSFLRCFAKKRSSAQQETAMLGLAEGKTILDR